MFRSQFAWMPFTLVLLIAAPVWAQDPAVQQLVERGRANPSRLAESIEGLARIGAWEELEQLLVAAAQAGLDAESKGAIAETVGPALMLRIMNQEPIQDASRAFLEECREAAAQRRGEAQRLSEAIAQLSGESVDERIAAMRILLDGGEAAIQALVKAIVSEPSAEGRDDQLRVLMQLGPGGVQALRQLALYGQPPQRTAALSAIARINASARTDAQEGLADLLTALHAPSSSEAERQTAAAALQRSLGATPGRSAALEWLAERLRLEMRHAEGLDKDGQTQTIWTLDADGKSVVPITSYQIVAAYREAYDAAARLLRVGDLPPEFAQDALIADLSYRVLIDPEWGDDEDRQAIGQVHTIGADTVSAALERALQWQNWPAAVGLLRLIEADDNPLTQDRWLRGDSGEPTPLVRAATAADPRVRYEAVSAITRLAPVASYPGISFVRRTAVEMQTLGERPIAVLVETRDDVSQRLESLLTQLGHDVRVVRSVRSLERLLETGGDVSFIVAKTQLADAAPIELVDRVRRTPKGQTIPIAFFGESVVALGEDRWRAPTLQISEPVTTAGFRPLLDAIELRRRLPPLSGVDRRLYRDVAIRFASGARSS